MSCPIVCAPVAGGFEGININTVQPGTVSVDGSGVITMQGAGYVIGTTGDNISGRTDGFYYLAMPLTVFAELVAGVPNALVSNP